MSESNWCWADRAIPCCGALRIMMYHNYISYIREHRLSDIFYDPGNEKINGCCVPKKYCTRYQSFHGKSVCRYNRNLLCDKSAQLKEYARQNPKVFVDADKWDKCMCNPALCLRYLIVEKQR